LVNEVKTMMIRRTFEKLLDLRKYPKEGIAVDKITFTSSEIEFNLIERIKQGIADCYGARCEIIIRSIEEK